MLDARERRACEQRRLTESFGLPLICFTLNIAGEIKSSPLIELAFFEGVRLIREFGFEYVHESVDLPHTGPTAYFVFRAEAEELKRRAVLAEDSAPEHRLFDIDVIDAAGNKLSRTAPRACVVCGGPAKDCARSRVHGLDAVKAAQNGLLNTLAARLLAKDAARALTLEVEATPKPGLVDMNNSGAHTDMDINSFYASIASLEPFFREFALAGLTAPGCGPELMPRLRSIGIRAEAAMLIATGGVNTHRGAIYGMGLLLASRGLRLSGAECGLFELAAKIASQDTAVPASSSHGGAARKIYGAHGARGEAKSGFPAARCAAALYTAYLANYDERTAAALTLPHIMAELCDTNLLHRGGLAGLEFVQSEARRICCLPESERRFALLDMDAECVRRNLSPGGSADMLGLAVLAALWREG